MNPSLLDRARRRAALLALALACLIAGAPALAETLYVRSGDAELRDTPSASGATVASLERGAELTVLARDGRVQVRAGSRTGWIHKLKVSADEPRSSDGVLAGLGGGRGDYVKEAESGRGARGLEESAERYARDEQLGDAAIATVQRMERFQVSDNALRTFLREGGLGEYAP